MKPPQPPEPPSIIAAEPTKKKTPRHDPIEELGIAPDLFAAAAMSSPIEWDGEQLDNLQRLFVGEDIEPEVKEELVEEVLSPPRRSPSLATMPPQPANTNTAGPTLFTPEAASTPTLLDVPSSRVDIDDWLKKAKS